MPRNTSCNKCSNFCVRGTGYRGPNDAKALEGTSFWLTLKNSNQKVTPVEQTEGQRRRKNVHKRKTVS
jgi:hypothetical protein